MNVKRGLFFDLDGTLADTLSLLKNCYLRFLSAHGKEGSNEEFDSLNGPPLHVIVDILKHKYLLEETGEYLMKQYIEIVQQSYLKASPNPGAVDVLKLAVQEGWKCAVVTSNSEELAQKWLTHHGLFDMITAIVGKESSPIGKPHPTPYQMALEKLGCLAESSIAVEDSMAGIQSAISAGIPTFGYFPLAEKTSGMAQEGYGILHHFSDLIPWLIETKR